MNKKELKKLMKPIVEECIREVLLEEGVLSTIISEVVRGTSGLVVEQKAPPQNTRQLQSEDETMLRLQERKAQTNQRRKNLMDAIGKDAYGGVDLFEGTQPLTRHQAESSGAESGQGALSGYAPDDAGVNIDGLLNIAGGAWKKIK
ncbi:MAG: hypothetical protein GOVbin703_91 [Prokaryotic dsDNA virus sp.]|nr:MAG: hypothetical protein GOVbin703_91 [Prokaryotic dsDNA virus sp.]|tara:strand:- start:118 stop:555 length:438 start_codon:yes stop_codon:yes gene_type:complete